MAHVRTQIREQFKTVLETALPSAGYDVFASRRYARNDTGKATVDMAISNDQTQAREVMGDARIHIASLYIRVQRARKKRSLMTCWTPTKLRWSRQSRRMTGRGCSKTIPNWFRSISPRATKRALRLVVSYCDMTLNIVSTRTTLKPSYRR